MKRLLGLFVISGAVLGALIFLTGTSVQRMHQPAQALTLKPGGSVQDGSIVSIQYTLTDETGKVIESNVGKEPLTYVQGAGQIVKGLEREMNGLKIGDQKTVEVKPQDGYGVRDPKALQEVLREKIPPEAQHVGAMLMTKAPDGRSIPMRVNELKDKTVIVDFNHPLAGKTLTFDIKVTDIKAADSK
jgi:FKBP-type peptidyl-prolyl cis-trans isomerase SlyD